MSLDLECRRKHCHSFLCWNPAAPLLRFASPPLLHCSASLRCCLPSSLQPGRACAQGRRGRCDEWVGGRLRGFPLPRRGGRSAAESHDAPKLLA